MTFTIKAYQDSAVNKYIKLISRGTEVKISVIMIDPLIEWL